MSEPKTSRFSSFPMISFICNRIKNLYVNKNAFQAMQRHGVQFKPSEKQFARLWKPVWITLGESLWLEGF